MKNWEDTHENPYPSNLMPKFLPVPNKPYPDWSRFLAAVWKHGMSHKVMDPQHAYFHSYRAHEAIKETMARSNGASMMRPSSFLSCARQSYFFLGGEEPSPMPENIGLTFSVGHLLHELSYAAVRSAIPEGIEAEFEKKVDLPDWWPEHEKFNRGGTVDLVLRIADKDEAAKYFGFPDTLSDEVLVDFKTMGGFSWREHGKKQFDHEPDAFGYLAQLAIYRDALGFDGGAIMAGINRDALASPLKPRWITPHILDKELARVKAAVQGALDGDDPGRQFQDRWKDNGNFYCGKGGKKGYCPFAKVCSDREPPDNG